MVITSVLARGQTVARSGLSTAVEKPLETVLAVVGLLIAGDFVVALLVTGGLGFAEVGQLAKNGLMRGLVIGLAGVGLSMTYSILNFANFSHGDYITFGAFAGWGVTYLVAGFGEADWTNLLLVGAGGGVYGAQLGISITGTPLAVVVGLVLAGATTAGLALLVDRGIYKSMRDAGGIPLLITSVGVAFALRYVIALSYNQSVRGTTSTDIPTYQLPAIDGTIGVNAHDLVVLASAVALMLGVHFLLQRTKLGKAMRAMADNEDLALVTGIPTERVVTWTWVVGGALTGVSGFLLVLWRETINFRIGWVLLLLVFSAVILGGIGSIYGAIFGGVIIGLTLELSQIWIPTDFARASAFALMIVILLVRPKGLFAGRSTA
ncbi:branched-chain amino acid ABC transporter permease [Halobacteriales archaeon QH_10_67_22]|nr:MAG: branched-chain amino acid ABC transporter permease [Halobacteriales archaeon QH_10_67_22]